MRIALLILLTASLSLPAPVEAKPDFASRYTRLSRCKQVAQARGGEDWVYYRCNGLGSIPVWYICMDSNRCRYGFGVKPNVSGMFGTGRRGEAWPIEWRGRLRAGRLEAVSTIVRAREPDQQDAPEMTSMLYVYRLRADGTSCIVGTASSNADARRIADTAAGRYRCKEEPELP